MGNMCLLEAGEGVGGGISGRDALCGEICAGH